MPKETKKNLPPVILFRYQRKGLTLEEHLKAMGLQGAPYVGLNGDWRAYGLEDNPKFRKANYLAVTGIGEVLGEERGIREKAEKPAKAKKEKADKPKAKIEEGAGKPAKQAKKNGKGPLKVKNAEGKVVEAGGQA
jgi:hypothetical protein